MIYIAIVISAILLTVLVSKLNKLPRGYSNVKKVKLERLNKKIKIGFTEDKKGFFFDISFDKINKKEQEMLIKYAKYLLTCEKEFNSLEDFALQEEIEQVISTYESNSRTRKHLQSF